MEIIPRYQKNNGSNNGNKTKVYYQGEINTLFKKTFTETNIMISRIYC